MTILQAIKKIQKDFDELLAKQNSTYNTQPAKEAIWFHTTDHADSYEVDEEWLGITATGKIAWAYASGCSCWDGDFTESLCETKDLKEFEFEHEDMKAEWQEKLIEFAEKL